MATPQPKAPEQGTPEGYDSNAFMAWIAVSIAAWLVMGGVGHADAEMQDSTTAFLLTLSSIILQIFAIFFALLTVNVGWPGRGKQVFAAGTIGFGLATFWAVSSRPSRSGVICLFWGLSGMYVGWLCEALTGGFAGIAGRLNRAAPANRREP